MKIPEKLDGILILSGATNPYLTKEYNQISLGSSSERLIEAINIIKKKQNIKIIFSGGPAHIQHPNLTDSNAAIKFFDDMEINISNIIFENKSRNTYENILFSKNIIKPKKNENWIVISSASHLKRVLNVAEKINWILVPYATDFNYPKKYKFQLSLNLFSNLSQFQRAAHEWIGLIYYYLSGKSDKI